MHWWSKKVVPVGVILETKDLKSKLNMASALLLDLKAELNAYMESIPNQESARKMQRDQFLLT